MHVETVGAFCSGGHFCGLFRILSGQHVIEKKLYKVIYKNLSMEQDELETFLKVP